MQRVAFFEFTVFQGVFPLATGNLEAAARADPLLREQFTFEKFSTTVEDPDIQAKVRAVDADIYAFSCYVWNTGLVRRLVRLVRALRPQSYILLGGPQVMNRGHIYLTARDSRTLICNGEGERTFPNLLRQLAAEQPDFHAVRGLSFYDEGKLCTTPPEERVKDLNEIPSPYLSGLMDPRRYVWAVLETNRGCPFRCTYCYWGGATNAKVNKYSSDRLMDEITWIGDNHVLYLFFADANFGMLQRDVDIARHIVETRKRTGFPLSVYFSSSKNTPHRVAEIAGIFADSNLVSTMPISLQTMSDTTLLNVKRENIRPESYLQLQAVLNERHVSSFIEMIWPLPGETLASFVAGIGELCSMGALCFRCYPLLLIGNVEMENQVAEYGLISVKDPDPNSEARIVIATKDVTHAEYLDGVRISFHITALRSLRGLWHVGRYLNDVLGVSYGELFTRFNEFCRARPGHPYVKYIEDTLRASGHYKFHVLGGVIHNILHSFRQPFDDLLADFVRTMGWFADEEVALRLELDLLNRPYIYSNTDIPKMHHLRVLNAVPGNDRDQLVEVPGVVRAKVGDILGLESFAGERLVVSYKSDQLPYMSGKSLENNYTYCQDRHNMLNSLLPVWSAQ